MPKKRSLTLVITLLVLLTFSCSLLYGCRSESAEETSKTQEEAKTDGKKTADVIKLAGGDWGYPTPYGLYPRGPGMRKMNLIYDSLVGTDADGKIIPKLATKWQDSEDGLVYTLKLRPEVKWHDGQPFTSDDVIFSYEYQKKYLPVSGGCPDVVKQVKQVDKQTVEIHIEEPDVDFLSSLSSWIMIPKHIWEGVTDPNNFTNNSAVGTGPYKLTEYSKEHGTYRFVANPDFWGSKPWVNEIKFVPAGQAILAFEQGEIDRNSVTPDILSRYEDKPEYKIMSYETSWAYRLYFNMAKRPELAEESFRQAVAYAIDRQELVDKIERGNAIPGSPGVLHPNNEYYNAKAPQYPHDTEKAKKLLNGLGYKDTDTDGILKNNNGEKLSFQLVCDDGSARLAEVIKQQLAEAGIEVVIKSVDMKVRDARFQDGDYELCINGSGNGEDLSELTNISGKGKATSTSCHVRCIISMFFRFSVAALSRSILTISGAGSRAVT
jgi:peptide/nickel transport system substrate-binding protein